MDALRLEVMNKIRMDAHQHSLLDLMLGLMLRLWLLLLIVDCIVIILSLPFFLLCQKFFLEYNALHTALLFDAGLHKMKAVTGLTKASPVTVAAVVLAIVSD
jgi:hypothetical protein